MDVPALVLFDLDETLFDHFHASHAAVGMRAVWFNRRRAARPASGAASVGELVSFEPPEVACRVILSG